MNPVSMVLPVVLSFAAVEEELKIPADTELVTTDSGLQYSILQEGQGGDHPRLQDVVKVHYTGWLTDGTVFDSSVQRGTPAEFPLGRVVAGWQEGIQLMTLGSRIKLTIPPELGYGSRGAGPIPANSTLIFEVELLEIRQGPPDYQPIDSTTITTTESGLKYQTLKGGAGEAAGEEQVVEMKFACWDPNERLLGCSEHQGSPLKARMDKYPWPFLREVVEKMLPGSVCLVEVPAALSGQPGDMLWRLEMIGVSDPLPLPVFRQLDEGKTETRESGLKVETLAKGDGKTPKMGEPVTVHYAGWLTDGTSFDSSFSRGGTATFNVGQLIQGWNEALQNMQEGGKVLLHIPSNLAYGPRGSGQIPPNAELIFYMELVKVGN